MPIYKVVKRIEETQFVFIEADNEDLAAEAAQEIYEWNDGKYNSDNDLPEIAGESELNFSDWTIHKATDYIN